MTTSHDLTPNGGLCGAPEPPHFKLVKYYNSPRIYMQILNRESHWFLGRPVLGAPPLDRPRVRPTLPPCLPAPSFMISTIAAKYEPAMYLGMLKTNGQRPVLQKGVEWGVAQHLAPFLTEAFSAWEGSPNIDHRKKVGGPYFNFSTGGPWLKVFDSPVFCGTFGRWPIKGSTPWCQSRQWRSLVQADPRKHLVA